jgi:hypothetical protein
MPHITFIHGLANKPAADRLLDLWQRALARDEGIDCGAEGVTTSMVYWADVLYPSPDPNVEPLESADEQRDAEREAMAGDDPRWRAQLSGSERQFVEALAAKVGADLPSDVAPPTEVTRGATAAKAQADNRLAPAEVEALEVLERIPLPWAIKKPLMKLLVRDAHHYFFNVKMTPRPADTYAVQDELRRRFLDAVKAGAAQEGPHLVVSHSMGTVIAYDCLKRVPECPAVDELITLGSPLGLDEVQDQLRPEYSGDDGFPAKVRGGWVNIYDPLDPVVGFDPKFGNDYRRAKQPAVRDIKESNWGTWRHSITKYLHGTELRRTMKEMLKL